MDNASSTAEGTGQDGKAVALDLLADRIWIYGGAVLILCGTVGNVLSFFVMIRKSLERHTTAYYLAILAVVDTAVLYTGLVRYWIRALVKVDIRNVSVPGCKIHIFFVYFLMQFEAWILVWVAVERLAAIFFPHRAKVLFTRRFASIQVAITGAVLMAANSQFFWSYTIVGSVCLPSNARFDFFHSFIWSWIDFVLASFAPFVLMLSINVAIIIRLVHLQRMKKQNLRVSINSKMNTMTAILITVSFIFFLTTAPITIYNIIEFTFLPLAKTAEQKGRIKVMWACVNVTAYVNFSTNFILYCLSGSQFRKELIKMLRDKLCVNQVHPVATISGSTALVSFRANT